MIEEHFRRTYMVSVGLTAMGALAGCIATEPDTNGEDDSDVDGDDEPDADGEDEPDTGEEEETNPVRNTPEDAVDGFLRSIAADDISTYNQMVYEIAEADSMTDVLNHFGTFRYYFEEDIDTVEIDSIEIDEITAVDVETLVRDVLDADEEDVEENIQEGDAQITDVKEEYGFDDSAVIYTSYSATGVEIEDYLLVVNYQDEWLVFDSLVY